MNTTTWRFPNLLRWLAQGNQLAEEPDSPVSNLNDLLANQWQDVERQAKRSILAIDREQGDLPLATIGATGWRDCWPTALLDAEEHCLLGWKRLENASRRASDRYEHVQSIRMAWAAEGAPVGQEGDLLEALDHYAGQLRTTAVVAEKMRNTLATARDLRRQYGEEMA